MVRKMGMARSYLHPVRTRTRSSVGTSMQEPNAQGHRDILNWRLPRSGYEPGHPKSKPMVFRMRSSGRLKRRGEVSKNELMRPDAERLSAEGVSPFWQKLVFVQNLSFIHQGLGKEFPRSNPTGRQH